MSKYAAETDVPPERSRQDIERVLDKYGATAFFYASEDGRATIGFRAHERFVRFVLPLPTLEEFKWVRHGCGHRMRSDPERKAARDKAMRQRWRCLLLAVKAKLEVVDSGIASFEQEFLAHILLPSGETVGDAVAPHLHQAYVSGKNVPLLTEMVR